MKNTSKGSKSRGRPKGSKDKKLRKVNPKSLGNLHPFESENRDFYALGLVVHVPKPIAEEWKRMTPKQRGQVLLGLLTE